MDSPPIRVASKPADRNEARMFNNLTSSNQLNKNSVSEEQHLPVLTRVDDCSAVSSRVLPAEMAIHTDLPAGAPSQERLRPLIYEPISDTESESVVEKSPDRSRKPRKMPSSQIRSPSYGSLYAKTPNTYNRRSFSVHVSTDSESDDENHTTLEIERLKKEIQDLEAKRMQKNSRAVQPQSEPSRYQTLYRLGYEVRPNVRGTSSDEYSSSSDSDGPYQRGNDWYLWPGPPRTARSLKIFTDPPALTHDRWGKASLHCSRRLNSLKPFLKANPDISFVVFYDYNRSPEARVDKPKPNCETMHDEEFGQPTPCANSIYPVSKELKRALELILEDREEYSNILSQYWITNELSAPYLFIYHSRQEIPRIKEELSKPAQDQLDLFLEYVMNEFGDEYNTVDALLQRKEILPQYLHYLIKKGDILLENRNGEYTGYKAESWPIESIRRTPDASIAHKYAMPGNRYESPYDESGVAYKWTLNGFTWGFDGNFFGRWKQLKLEMARDESSLPELAGDETRMSQIQGRPITELAVFPLRYAPDHIQKMLYHRGDVLWKCRVRQLVSYQFNEHGPISNGMEEHYMIDMKTYQSLHSKDKTRFDPVVYPRNSPPPKKQLSKAKMARNNPPGDDFKVLMPSRIKGYNFFRKEWCDLKVDQISDVVWREETFRTLEIDYEAKDLIRALVANHLEIGNLTDSTAGKGNGLTLLLHGGPGTGKTHTAESVAEIAKKPLYRVTCGDLGTNAEVVEDNLKSALHLARLWGCVVLLDEADIFLEQTSLGDLERNALASVFLRMLASYNGIVILTTSRVGTFNEACRTQIQLALHYPDLNPYQRSMIWRNLIGQLVLFSSDDLDISDLYEHVESLGNENLDGRHIRTILTNARRYTRWKNVPLTYKHIKDVIEVSTRFDTFLENSNGGGTQNDLAFDEWLH